MLSDFVEIEEFEEEAEEEEEEGEEEERKKEPKKKVPLFKLQAKNSKSVSTMDRWARKNRYSDWIRDSKFHIKIDRNLVEVILI